MKQKQTTKLVTVIINGAAHKINPDNIMQERRTSHHGTFRGTKVNSPQTFVMGDSIIIWPEAGKTEAFSMPRAAYCLMAQRVLRTEGVRHFIETHKVAS